MVYISIRRSRWPVARLCHTLGVSESGYYKHLRFKNKPDKHANLLAQIYELIKKDEENANYGVRRIYDYLRLKRNYNGSLRTIYRICKENNLMIRMKRKPNGITKADAAAQKSENLIKQDFTAKAPNQKWLTDITEIPCKEGKLYLAPILDCYDGTIRGFKMDNNIRADLCVDAFQKACRDDNARMESFFATLKKEKLYKIDTKSMLMAEVKTIVYRYIHYYNRRRIYSTNGGYPPQVYRELLYENQQLAA